MKNILVKVHNATQTVKEVQVVTQDGKPTVIKADHNVNYEFIDQAIQHGPNHIITKRVGNDLQVSFEEDGKEADLIIEDFYKEGTNGLIGLNEDGQYYYYIPDTGNAVDYVTALQNGDIEGQALGGSGYVAPWWAGVVTEHGTMLPWLAGLAGLAAIGAAIGGGNDDGNDSHNNTTNNALVVSKPTLTNLSDTTTITGQVKDSSGNPVADSTVTITLPNGTVLTTKTDANGNYTIPLTATQVDSLKDGGTIEIVATKPSYDKGMSELPIADAPDITTNKDGDVIVEAPPKEATSETITYIPTGSTTPVTATITKDSSGNWVSNDPNTIVDPTTGAATIPGEKVADNTPVSAIPTIPGVATLPGEVIALPPTTVPTPPTDTTPTPPTDTTASSKFRNSF